GLLHRGKEFVAADRNLQTNCLGRVVEAPQVRISLKNPAVVNANTLEHAVAVEKAMIVNTDFRFGLIDERAVEPDFGHRNSKRSESRGQRSGLCSRSVPTSDF